jgi:hypothetical protein
LVIFDLAYPEVLKPKPKRGRARPMVPVVVGEILAALIAFVLLGIMGSEHVVMALFIAHVVAFGAVFVM